MAEWTSDIERADGVTINKLGDERWVIRLEGRTIQTCPCCNRPMRTAQAARRVADAVLPVPANGGAQPGGGVMEVLAEPGPQALARFMTDLIRASSRPAGADLTTELASTDAGELMVLLRINKGRRCVLKLNQARKFTAALLNTEIMPESVRQFADVLGEAARIIQTVVDQADALAPHRHH